MNDLSKSIATAASGMAAQSGRLRHLSENIANADTPGYRRKLASFESTMNGDRAGTVTLGPVTLDKSALTRVHDPSHPMADDTGYYDSSNVNLLIEIADAREAQRSYEANLKLFDQAREMSRGLMELLQR